MRKMFALAAVIVLMHPAAAANLATKDYLGKWCSPDFITTITPITIENRMRFGPVPRPPRRGLTITKFDVATKRAIVDWVIENPNTEIRITGQTVLELSDDKQQLTMRDPPDAADKKPPQVLGRCD